MKPRIDRKPTDTCFDCRHQRKWHGDNVCSRCMSRRRYRDTANPYHSFIDEPSRTAAN